ncbi:hypothetical protein BDV28DRAFT_101803 [Aspergillus coremiiformis]|uniref:Uncharacterized protein n=1 Tax=Aspergillus coremiiformis TaxID=138285 RepID=A0A5N6ZC97_9EURO|nr:hypothetical protein BDV28DRAFT_101803 [Aspergillus coremiiformis]
MASDDQGCSTNRRRQAFSFSVTLRPSIAKRARIVRPPTSPPSCEESAHYPVFNPRDPRHNPTAATSSWDGGGYYISQNTNLESPVSWMQSLRKQSLRKARSGLVALRAGMQRRTAIFGTNRTANVPRSWPLSDTTEGSSDQQDDSSFPSTVSEASTEEDSDFGTHLHRTECNDSSSLSCDADKCLDNWPFSVTITDLNPFQELTGGYWPPGPFLTEAANSIFPGDSTEGNNGLGLQISRELTTGDYIQLDDCFLNECDSQSEESLPRLSRSSKSPPEVGCSIPGTNTERAHSTILVMPLSSNTLAPATPRTTSVSGNVHQTMSSLSSTSSPELRRSSASDDEVRDSNVILAEQPPGRFYVSRTPQVSNSALVVESHGLIDRVSGYSDNSISRTEDNIEGQAIEPATHQQPPLDLRAEPVVSDCVSIIDDNQTPEICGSRPIAGVSSTPGQTVLTLNMDLGKAASEIQSDDDHCTSSRPSIDTRGLDSGEFSREQAPWSTRPSDEATTTDLTSVSNNLWSPIENGDLTSLLSFTDEYFFVDGKTRSHPDRGDDPTKAEWSIVSEGSLYSGPGSSAGTLDVPEIIGPRGPIHMQPPRPYRTERDPSDDSVDEYLLTYPMYQRRYFS